MQSPQNTSAPTWTNPAGYGAMHNPRIYANAVLLPTLELLVIGGSANHFHPFQPPAGGGDEVPAQPVYTPEILDLTNPAAGWTVLAPSTSPRLYHQVAVLLPDGRILVAGGYKLTNLNNPSLTHSDAEVFVPPYLQTGHYPPMFVNPPSTITYGQSLVLDVHIDSDSTSTLAAPEIDFVTLIRCASVTHHFDWDQRCLRLDVVQPAVGNTITLQPIPAAGAPGNGDAIAPPGYYMMFLVRKAPPGGRRVPSLATFVRLQ